MDKLQRNERIAALIKILSDSPGKIFTLGYFTEMFGSAKSTISEDIDIVGNILAFMPLGFFSPILFRRKRYFIIVVFISGFVSLTVEILQYSLVVGNFDVDDIILNTLGGFIGYIIFRVCYYIYYGIKYLRDNK